MEKKTKLITIDYDEYLSLIRVKNNNEIEVKYKLIGELHNLRNVIADRDVNYYLIQIINKIECDIEVLQKEGETNEL